MGKLIVIESGTDGSGKQTQTEYLYNRLISEGYSVKRITFPNYKHPSCAPIEEYLAGALGENPSSVNPYAVSSMYANDRFFSYVQDWGKFYNDGGIILADRYTTSNMVHQAAKMDNLKDKEKYLDWLYDLEFNKYELPKPDCVIFLDVPLDYSKKLMKDRANKIDNSSTKDIHERDMDYLAKSYENSLYIANKYDWTKIQCVKNDDMLSIEDIHKSIYTEVKNKLNI